MNSKYHKLGGLPKEVPPDKERPNPKNPALKNNKGDILIEEETKERPVATVEEAWCIGANGMPQTSTHMHGA